MAKRTVFFVSDRTAITVEMFGHSLLTQFPTLQFDYVTLPFVDSETKAEEAVMRIDRAAHNGLRPVVFSTLVDAAIKERVRSSHCLFLDCFNGFLLSLENEFTTTASRTIGMSHTADNSVEYHQRIDSVNFSLAHDDGLGTRDLSSADLVLVGVSRCGKTPTSLYMALQFGTRAANYPLIPEDLAASQLPDVLRACRGKLYGLTIDPDRLHEIRNERRPGSEYAALANCRQEVREAERLMRQEGISILDTTKKSIEEIATTILHQARLTRHVY